MLFTSTNHTQLDYILQITSLHQRAKKYTVMIIIRGMYLIAIFKIQPEPDSTGYQTKYLARPGYLITCCIANFFGLLRGMNNKSIIPVFVVFDNYRVR